MSEARRSPAGPSAGVWRGAQFGKHVTANLMRILPVGAYAHLLPRRVIGMCYHVVSDRDLPHVRNLYRYKSAAQFEADLLFLRRHFHLASYEEIRSGTAPPNAVLVTFDDGLAECFTTARPILLEHRVPCVFFVSPPHLDNRRMFSFDKASLAIGRLQEMEEGEERAALRAIGARLGIAFTDLPDFARWITRWIRTLERGEEPILDDICGQLRVPVEAYLADHRPYMTREQVITLAGDGFTIGAHGLRHVALGAFSDEEVIHEILASCRDVAGLVGAEQVPFAFPFDADGVERGLLAQLRRDHPEVGLFFDTRQLRCDVDFMVNRLIVDVPALVGGSRSNLGGYLRNAYLDELLRTGARLRGRHTNGQRSQEQRNRAPTV